MARKAVEIDPTSGELQRTPDLVEASEVATTPTMNAIPRADANGKLDAAWIPAQDLSSYYQNKGDLLTNTAAGTSDINEATTARGATATASSTYSYFIAGRAIDGNDATEWGANATSNQWLRVDLGTARRIAKFRVLQTAVGTGWFMASYQLQYSTDDVNWNIAGTVTSTQDTGRQAITPTPITARYWRVFQTTSTTNGPVIFSFELYSSGYVVEALHIGADGQVLTAVNGLPAWATPSSSDPTLGGDLSGKASAATVAKLQGRPVAASAPTDKQGLVWNAAAGQWEPAAAASPLTLEETDGAPSIANVTKIKVSPGTLVDEGGGVARLTTGGGSGGGSGGAIAVREADGSPSIANVTTIEVSGATVSDQGGGVARLTVEAGGEGSATVYSGNSIKVGCSAMLSAHFSTVGARIPFDVVISNSHPTNFAGGAFTAPVSMRYLISVAGIGNTKAYGRIRVNGGIVGPVIYAADYSYSTGAGTITLDLNAGDVIDVVNESGTWFGTDANNTPVFRYTTLTIVGVGGGPVSVTGTIYRFQATLAADQAFANGEDKKVLFTQRVYDEGGCYDTTNAQWKPPAGPIWLGVSLSPNNNWNDSYIYAATLYKNGVIWKTVTVNSREAIGGLVTDIASGSDSYHVQFVQYTGGSRTLSAAGVGRAQFFGWTAPIAVEQSAVLTTENERIGTVLADVTLTASGTWDLPNISQAFDDLVLEVWGRDTVANTVGGVTVSFNGDTTDANYHGYRHIAVGSGAEYREVGFLPGASINAASMGYVLATIPGYRSSAWKLVHAHSSSPDTDNVAMHTTSWRNTSAITRIMLTARGAGFAAGTRIRLIGVRTVQSASARTIAIEETDGGPSLLGVSKLLVSPGSLTDLGNGVAQLSTGAATGSGAITVKEVDGAPELSDITTLEVDGATLSSRGDGVARLTLPDLSGTTLTWVPFTPTLKQGVTIPISPSTCFYAVVGPITFFRGNITALGNGTGGVKIEVTDLPQALISVAGTGTLLGTARWHNDGSWYRLFSIYLTTASSWKFLEYDQYLDAGVGPADAIANGDSFLIDGWTISGQSGQILGASPTGFIPAGCDYIRIEDQKAQGTAGGAFTGGSYQTRALNTEVSDAAGRAGLSGNRVTLAAGNYYCVITCPSYHYPSAALLRARLYNVTAGTALLVSDSQYGQVGEVTVTTIRGRFTLLAPAALEVQHFSSVTTATEGFGVASNQGGEIYTIAEFWREHDDEVAAGAITVIDADSAAAALDVTTLKVSGASLVDEGGGVATLTIDQEPQTPVPALLASQSYCPVTELALNKTGSPPTAYDAANLAVTFTAPASGAVMVSLSAYYSSNTSGGNSQWALLSGGAVLPGSLFQLGSTIGRVTARVRIPGLMPGAVYTFVWGGGTTGGSHYFYAGGTAGNVAGPALMEVWDADQVTTVAQLTAAGERYTYYDPDKPPKVASALDDEFTGPTLAAKWTALQWTQSGFSASITADALVCVGGTSNSAKFLLQPLPTGDFTVYTKVQVAGSNVDSSSGLILAPAADGTGTSEVVRLYLNGTDTRVIQSRWSAYAWSSNPSQVYVQSQSYYFAFRRSGTTYSWGMSGDGKIWRWTTFTPASTPAYVGLFFDTNGSTAYHVIEFFRYFASATADLGGYRTVAGGAPVSSASAWMMSRPAGVLVRSYDFTQGPGGWSAAGGTLTTEGGWLKFVGPASNVPALESSTVQMPESYEALLDWQYSQDVNVGLVFRYVSDTQYYAVSLNATEINLYRYNGGWTSLAKRSDPAVLSAGTSVRVLLRVVGSVISVFLNDTLYLHAADTTWVTGRLGIRANVSTVQIQNLRVYSLPSGWTPPLPAAPGLPAASVPLSEWAYRIPITISNTGAACSAYQIPLTIDTYSLIARRQLRTDLRDLRFTAADRITILPHWVESGAGTTQTRIWVRAAPPAGTSTIYLYYGRPAADVVVEDPRQVFWSFEDFEGVSTVAPTFAVSPAAVWGAGYATDAAFSGTRSALLESYNSQINAGSYAEAVTAPFPKPPSDITQLAVGVRLKSNSVNSVWVGYHAITAYLNYNASGSMIALFDREVGSMPTPFNWDYLEGTYDQSALAGTTRWVHIRRRAPLTSSGFPLKVWVDNVLVRTYRTDITVASIGAVETIIPSDLTPSTMTVYEAGGAKATNISELKFVGAAVTNLGGGAAQVAVEAPTVGEVFSYRDPDKAPAAPSILDDEFTDTDLDVKWTRHQWTQSGFSARLAAGSLICTGTTSNSVKLLLQPLPAGDFTVYAKAAILNSTADNSIGIVLSPTNDATGTRDSASFYFRDSTSSVNNHRWVGYVWSSGGTNQRVLAQAMYIAVRRAGTSYTYGFSPDGVSFVWKSFTPGSTPAYIGLLFDTGADGATHRVDFFRYFPDSISELGGTRNIGNAVTSDGPQVGAGPLSSKSATGAAGAIYATTDSPYLFVGNGAGWSAWGPVQRLSPPPATGWSWDNQGDAAVSASQGDLVFTVPTNANGISRAYYRPAPPTPYVVTARLVMPFWMSPAAAEGFGLCFRQASDGKIHAFYVQAMTTLLSNPWTNASTWGGSNYATLTIPAPAQMWLRIADDGTNRVCSVSATGRSWQAISSVARTTFLTADQVGVFLRTGTGYTFDASVLSWQVESNGMVLEGDSFQGPVQGGGTPIADSPTNQLLTFLHS